MIKILCVGKIKESYLDDLINYYKKRIGKYIKIEIPINTFNVSANSRYCLKKIVTIKSVINDASIIILNVK